MQTLQEVTKILQKKVLTAINLYWFHNDATNKSNWLYMVIPTNLDSMIDRVLNLSSKMFLLQSIC